MTKRDDKAGLPLSQTLLLKEQLTKVEDRLHQLLASYQFYDNAVRSMVDPELFGKDSKGEDCHFGLCLSQQWLRQQGEDVVTELITTQQMVRGCKPNCVIALFKYEELAAPHTLS